MKTRGPNKFKNLSKSEMQKHSKAGEYDSWGDPIPDPTGWFDKQGVRYAEDLSFDFLLSFEMNVNRDNEEFFAFDGWLVLMRDHMSDLRDGMDFEIAA